MAERNLLEWREVQSYDEIRDVFTLEVREKWPERVVFIIT